MEGNVLGSKYKALIVLAAGIMLAASVPPSSAQRPPDKNRDTRREERREAPRQERREMRRAERGQSERPSFARPAPRPPEERGRNREIRPPDNYSVGRPVQGGIGQPPAEDRVPRPPRAGHAGSWLYQHRDVPLEQQEKALENDADFRKLPAQRQQQLRQRLQRFNSLPPDQKDRIIERMEKWEHLTPGQKQEARRLHTQMDNLPPGRRAMVETAIRDLRTMSPEQRQQVLNSPRFRNIFTQQERDMLNTATQLPLAPAQSGETGEEPR